MREAFQEQLESMFDELAGIGTKVETAIGLATEALMTGDADIAERVISADVEIDRARERVEDLAFSLLSLQQPVAGDLRTVVAGLRMVSELERMGDLSVHVAKIARLRVPNIAVPEEVRPTMTRMAQVAADMVHRVIEIITERDVEAAIALGRADEEMDQLRRTSFTELLSDSWSHGVEAAVDIALLGRYYERIADHAVSVANRVVFVVTGEYPAGVDAYERRRSRPISTRPSRPRPSVARLAQLPELTRAARPSRSAAQRPWLATAAAASAAASGSR